MMAAISKVSLADAFRNVTGHWQPHTLAELHGLAVKIVRMKGEFAWHRHEGEDELFLTLRGQIMVHLRDQDIVLREGELVVVPRGVEHRPEAVEEAEILLIEPVQTARTGSAV